MPRRARQVGSVTARADKAADREGAANDERDDIVPVILREWKPPRRWRGQGRPCRRPAGRPDGLDVPPDASAAGLARGGSSPPHHRPTNPDHRQAFF
jgi:hypothetical protein